MKGRELQGIRLRLGKTQEQLSAAMGVSSRTISRWEAHDLPVPQSAVERLQSLEMDDYRSLARVSSQRLVEELAIRAALWDRVGRAADALDSQRLLNGVQS